MFAQVKISDQHVLTGIYLAVVHAAFGVNLPFKKTLIVLTFIVGLLPVVGNLVSERRDRRGKPVRVDQGRNRLVAVPDRHPQARVFLNARIVGRRTECRALELLLAMLVMEAAFGVSGVIAAPIFYTYLKAELSDRGLV